ncbi:MAG: hypothetical protein HUK20_06880, partial [Fibrobacter sp.]|nr:hypothetical protein [Fibrobacter sp.]
KVEVLQYLQKFSREEMKRSIREKNQEVEDNKIEYSNTANTVVLNFALAPADNPWTMKRFFRRVKPVALILGENELWPGFLSGMKCFTGKPSVALVSGRFRRAFPCTNFSGLGFATLQTSSDCKRFLKYAAGSISVPVSEGGNWKLLPWARRKENPPSGSFENAAEKNIDIAFVSVHLEEIPSIKMMVLSAIHKQKKTVVIAPRRLEEVKKIREILNCWNVKCSAWPSCIPGEVALVNCFGVVGEILSRSKAAVVGGSFHKKLKIHDFWEALQMGVPTYVGPFHRGHENAVESLIKKRALVPLGKNGEWGLEPADKACISEALSQEREKILNSYGQLKNYVEELLK